MWSIHSHLHRRSGTRSSSSSSSSYSYSFKKAYPRTAREEGEDDDSSLWRKYSSDQGQQQQQQSQQQQQQLRSSLSVVLAPQDEEAFLQSLEKDSANDSSPLPRQQQQQQQRYLQHVVLPDEDTFDGICLRYNVTPLALRRANHGFSGTNLRLAPAVLHIPVQAKDDDDDDDSELPPPLQQDVTAPSYKLQTLRNDFPTLNESQAVAFLESHGWDLEAARQSLYQLCGKKK